MEAVHDDFEPTAVNNVRLTFIQIGMKTFVAAYSRDDVLQGPSTLAQHPGLCTLHGDGKIHRVGGHIGRNVK